MFLKFPSAVKDLDDVYHYGPELSVDSEHVVAVLPSVHSYHSFRPAQELCEIILDTGDRILVYAKAKDVHQQVEEAEKWDRDKE